MEDFFYLLCTMGLSQTMFFDGWNPNFDLIGELPYELSTAILRLLDGKTLLAAALVSRKWWRLIRSDRALRVKVRDVFVAERMANLYCKVRRSGEAVGEGADTEEENRRRRSEAKRAFGDGKGKKRKFCNEVSTRGAGKRTKTSEISMYTWSSKSASLKNWR